MLQDYLSSLDISRRRWFEWSQQVSTGKKLNRPSDSPADSARLVRIREEFSRSNQYLRNISGAQARLGVASSTLNSIRNLIMGISEKTIFGLTGTTSQESRNSIALEIKGKLENLQQLANTSIDGNYIFSGSRVDTPPLTESGGVFTYQGDDHEAEIEISQGEKVPLNVTGLEVFSDPSADLMNTVSQLISNLEAGDVDSATVNLAKIQEAGKVVDSARFKISKSINQADNANSRINDRQLDLTSEVSNLEDANMAEAMSRLVQAETALSAALSVGSRMRQGNLFDTMG
jgi:flagellar hook-associated protein 3 FlgL